VGRSHDAEALSIVTNVGDVEALGQRAQEGRLGPWPAGTHKQLTNLGQ
jgi:hypothetical protein